MPPQKDRCLRVILAQPRGFCAGVERAIEIVERALAVYGAPIYVRHEIVHNKRVLETLRAKGAVFVEELDEIPEGAAVIFSAHGVSKNVEEEAKRRGFQIIDATCPLVSKVHNEGRLHDQKGRTVFLIGHDGHPEVEGTRGRIPGGAQLVTTPEDVWNVKVDDPSQVAYVTQTTLSVDQTRDVIAALTARFPDIRGPDVKDICYATQNRQRAVRELAGQVDLLLVVGAANSSNANRLREIGEELGIVTHQIDDAGGICMSWFDSKTQSVGIAAGASAPEELVEEILDRLCEVFHIKTESLNNIREDMKFKLPKELETV